MKGSSMSKEDATWDDIKHRLRDSLHRADQYDPCFSDYQLELLDNMLDALREHLEEN